MNEIALDVAAPVVAKPRAAASAPTKTPHASEAVSPNGPLAALIERAQTGDRAALDALLCEVRPRALATAFKVLRNPDDAQDAVQDAFLKVWRSLDKFEGRSSFTTWIHRIVVNASLDLLRRQSCRPAVLDGHPDEQPEDPTVHEAATEPSPEDRVVAHQEGQAVHAALALLPPIHREVLVLREFEDLSYDEIASSAGCPVGTVMSRLHHARKRLADELHVVLHAPPVAAALAVAA